MPKRIRKLLAEVSQDDEEDVWDVDVTCDAKKPKKLTGGSKGSSTATTTTKFPQKSPAFPQKSPIINNIKTVTLKSINKANKQIQRKTGGGAALEIGQRGAVFDQKSPILDRKCAPGGGGGGKKRKAKRDHLETSSRNEATNTTNTQSKKSIAPRIARKDVSAALPAIKSILKKSGGVGGGSSPTSGADGAPKSKAKSRGSADSSSNSFAPRLATGSANTLSTSSSAGGGGRTSGCATGGGSSSLFATSIPGMKGPKVRPLSRTGRFSTRYVYQKRMFVPELR